MAHPRNEIEWRREVERRLAANSTRVGGIISRITPYIEDTLPAFTGKQPTAPIELVYGTSLYQSYLSGEWRGRFTVDFPDVTKAVDGTDLEIAGYELHGKQAGSIYKPVTAPPPSILSTPIGFARASVPSVKIGNAGTVRPSVMKGNTARNIPPQIHAYDGSGDLALLTTSLQSSLTVDNLQPGSQWTFRVRAIGLNSSTPGAWSVPVSVVIGIDDTSPSQLTKPELSVKLGTIMVRWDGKSVLGQLPGDFAYAELAQGNEAAPETVVTRFYSAGGIYVASGMAYYDPQFFRLRAVDTSGNVGPWSEQAVGYTTPLVDTDVVLSEIDAAKTKLINIDADESILSSTILTRHLVVTEDMMVALLGAHKIQAGDIEANAVTADKISAGAVTASKLEAVLALVTEIIAGNPLGTHASLGPSGFKAYSSVDGNAPEEVISLGTNTSDFLAITSPAGEQLAAISSTGDISAQNISAATDIYLKGESLTEKLNAMPKGMIAWGQVPINSNMSVAASNVEVGLFELGWEGADVPARMYEFNVNPFLINQTQAGIVGLRLRYTTDGSVPTITSPLIGFSYQHSSSTGLVSTGRFTRIIGSNNGPYLRVLLSLYCLAGTGVAEVWTGTGQTHLYSTVKDLGVTMTHTASATTGGGTPYTGSTTAAPTTPKVTKTTEWGYNGVRSYTGSNGWYNYNTAKGYQGLSPAGVGNLKSIWTFPSLTSTLSGATINDIWAYFYFEHWYYGSGGTAQIRLHNNSTVPATYNATGNGINSGGWPRGAGRWVRLPDSLYAGFASGTYKGLALLGDGTYTTYGIANNARLRIRYTK